MVALGERGQSLDVDPEQPAEGLGLGLAQLGRLGGDVLDGAMALAQLDPDDTVLADGSGGGSVALLPEGVDEGLGACRGVGAGGLDPGEAPLLHLGDPLVGEGAHRVVAGGLPQEAHGVGGQHVVVGGQVGVPGVADDPLAGGPATAPTTGGPGPPGHRTLRGELVEVATDPGRGQTELGGELGGRDRAELADRRQYAIPRTGVTTEVVGRRPRSVRCINHTSMLRNYF